MNKFLALAVMLVILWPASASARDHEVIIDTKFRADDGDTVHVDKDPVIPLESPSVSSVIPPSTIVVGKQVLGELQAPYALFTVAPRENEPEAAANAVLSWNLKKARLSSGRFAVSYQVVPVSESSQGGTFIVVLGDESGQRIQQHWANTPLTVFFKKGNLQATGKSATPLAISFGDVYTVIISFDLDAKTWSVTANGASIVDTAQFPEQFQNSASLQVIGLEFGSLGGRSDRPGGVYALQDVKMTRAD